MANFSELLNHIAKFLKGLIDRLAQILNLVDTAKNRLDEASEIQSEEAAKA